ncbi:MAG: hypothetical protein CO186_11750 [Zetaproteobacteria bacterium CG_4_9_14_3_um_filter_49_83]|nr:MAG: hypothetical protein AUJ56_09665 [Zetaproteobacteria bacterium CG1_02_49_23]PIQ30375.1 MAG: hypothetical protein COW62_12740 [Zetaproteobacteria bacterium CG17_big_fil_post_rev_8_21_14_2_50_50_13]PIY54738.1 MAG: hypothetical protein COZ00_13220 [Zetaproteobacteria bacterium CG_4_10_14_0_8_um_filter_49_80]PJA34127.1 MAG: hypothetical protein CO186_11750 [Zetaproteobacteria bacterium CG_4_9_14_3_um_filter_49_83]
MLMLACMLILHPTDTEAVDMKCFEAFHKCNVENKGQFSYCMDRKKACEAGQAEVTNTAPAQPVNEHPPLR